MNPIIRFFVLLLATSFCFAVQGILLAQDDLKPMFNDENLSGWVRTNTPPQTWRFEGGVLYCTGKPIGEIRTAKMYQNFVMELEWRHMVPGGNAGVFVWADDITSRGQPFHRGIEVQVLENAYGNNKSHTTHGDIFPIHGATMTPVNGRGGSRAFPTESRSNPSPQWNHYRIECRDGTVSLAVNGKVVTQGKDCVPRKGYICLESEGGVVEYRNVRIKELPGGDLPPDQVAIVDRGYHSLYSGLNLDGWKTDDEASWKVKNWILAFEADEEQTGTFSTEKQFTNANFVLDVRLKQPGSSLVVQAGDDLRIDLANSEIAAQLEKTGRWNRIEAINEAGRYRLKINGQELNRQDLNRQATKAETTSGTSGGKLVLKPTGPVDFANIYAAE